MSFIINKSVRARMYHRIYTIPMIYLTLMHTKTNVINCMTLDKTHMEVEYNSFSVCASSTASNATCSDMAPTIYKIEKCNTSNLYLEM